MWEAILGGVVSGAVSGFIAGWFASKWQRANASAGRDAAVAQAQDSGSVQQVSGAGSHRVAGADYHEHQAHTDASLVIDILKEDRQKRAWLRNTGQGVASDVRLEVDQSQFKGVCRLRAGSVPTKLQPGQSIDLGVIGEAMGSGGLVLTVAWKNPDGSSGDSLTRSR